MTDRKRVRAYLADCSSVVQFLAALTTVVIAVGGLWISHDIWHAWREQAIVTDSLTRPPTPRYLAYGSGDTVVKSPRVRIRSADARIVRTMSPAAEPVVSQSTAQPGRVMQTALVSDAQAATTAASVPVSAPPTPAPSKPAQVSRSLAKGTEIAVQPTADVCDAQLKPGAVIGARLAKDVPASDGSVLLAAGTPVRVEVVERRVASGEQEPVISLEATSIQTPTGVIAVESRTLHFVLEKPGIAGTVVKGSVIGALGGAALGLVLRQNVGKAALIGGAAGGVIGAARASSAQACIAASSTMFPFTLAQATEIH